MQQNTLPNVFEAAGAAGLLALVVGMSVLGLGVALFVRRGTRGQALALTVAAFLPFLLGEIGTSMGSFRAQTSIVRLGPAVTPKDLAYGQRQVIASKLFGNVATMLALCGAVAALARSES